MRPSSIEGPFLLDPLQLIFAEARLVWVLDREDRLLVRQVGLCVVELSEADRLLGNSESVLPSTLLPPNPYSFPGALQVEEWTPRREGVWVQMRGQGREV